MEKKNSKMGRSGGPLEGVRLFSPSEHQDQEIELGLDGSSRPSEKAKTHADAALANFWQVDQGSEKPAVAPRQVESRQASQRKREANCKNAQLSTGPRSARGKNFSRLNSLKHGLLARAIPVRNLPYSNIQEEDLRVLLRDLRSELRPEGRLAEFLVERIACLSFLFTRVYRFQRAGIDLAVSKEFQVPTLDLPRLTDELRRAKFEKLLLPDEAALAKIVRYESMLDREFRHCLDLLDRLQRRRRKNGSRGAEHADAPSPGNGRTLDKTDLLDF